MIPQTVPQWAVDSDFRKSSERFSDETYSNEKHFDEKFFDRRFFDRRFSDRAERPGFEPVVSPEEEAHGRI